LDLLHLEETIGDLRVVEVEEEEARMAAIAAEVEGAEKFI
jgi:hypothetical protein